jgi:hypothetical protein
LDVEMIDDDGSDTLDVEGYLTELPGSEPVIYEDLTDPEEELRDALLDVNPDVSPADIEEPLFNVLVPRASAEELPSAETGVLKSSGVGVEARPDAGGQAGEDGRAVGAAVGASAALAAEARAIIAGDGGSGGSDGESVEALTSPLLYGWVLDHPGAGLASLLAATPEAIVGALRAADRDGVVPSPANADALLRAVIELKARHLLQPAGEGGVSSVGDVLRSISAERRLGDAQERTVARLLAEGTPLGTALAERLTAAGLTERQVADVRLAFALDDLAAGDRSLLAVLASQTPPEHDGTLVHLAGLTPNRWMELVATGVAAVAAPGTELGQTLKEVPAVAADLAVKVERLHPSVSLKARLDAGLFPGLRFPAAQVAAFLGENPRFDIRDTDVEPFLVERGVDVDPELRTGLLQAQRLLRLGATSTELGALLATGLTDVAKIGLRDEHDIVTLLSQAMPSARAAAIHANARQLLTATLAVATAFVPALQPAPIRALDGGQAASAPRAFPSIQQLFGDQSACACGHCNSVLSPAAYLVDLLRLVDNAQAGPVLRARRPDIAEVELTCANTNTTLPYVDLALEILESAVAFPSPAVRLSPAERILLDQGTVPAAVRTELARHVRELRGDVTAETQVPESVADEAPARLVIRNGTRRWPASRWQRRMSIRWTPITNIPLVLEVPDADIDATVQSLDGGQVPASLVEMIAPEPQAPVFGTPTVELPPELGESHLPDSRRYRVTIVRSLLVQLLPGGWVGGVRLLRPDGTEIEGHNVQPGALVPEIAAELNAGRIHWYLRNFLPPLHFEKITWDAATSRWTLTSTMTTSVRFDPEHLVVDGLTYSGSSAQGDGEQATLFAENRDPEAYTRLRAAIYPQELPFDVFTEEVRACLSVAGTTRRSLLRTVRPSGAATSFDDACEVLGCAPAEARLLIETGATAARTAELWGLQENGNSLTDPDDAAADPVPPDWIGALRRLSVLLSRAGVSQSTLLSILDTRYLHAVGPAPRLQPPFECRASRVTVEDLGGNHLDRIQRFLRLQRITEWSVRDTGLVIDALTRSGSVAFDGEAAARAVAHVKELSERLRVPVRRVAAWLGRLETTPYVDHEAGGAPTRLSAYDEVFHSPQLEGPPADDFQLAPGGAELAYVAKLPVGDPLAKLTDRLGHLSASLHLQPAELAALIGSGPRAVVADELTLANLLTLERHVSFARALGLGVRDSRTLQLLAAVDPFPAPLPSEALDVPSLRLLELVDIVDAVRASGFTVEELAWCLDGQADEVAAAGRRRDQLQWLAGLQDALRAVQAAASLQLPDATLRDLLTAAGWPSPLQDRVLAGEGDQLGLASTPSLSVEFSATSEPQVPANLPFTVAQARPQHWTLRLIGTVTGAEEAAAFAALAQVPGLGPLTLANAPATRLRAQWDRLQQQARSLVRWLQSVELPRVQAPLRFSIQAARDSSGPRALPAAGFGPWIRSAASGDRLEIDGYLSAADARRLRSWALGATNEAAFRAEVDRITGVPAALAVPGAALSYDAAQRVLVLVGYPSAGDVDAFEAISDDQAFGAAVGQLAAASAAWVEQRPGRQVLGERKVLDLFTELQVPEERYAHVHNALVPPVRRRVAARLAAARAGIDPRLFEALDRGASLGAPGVDPLEPLCSQELLGVVIRSVGAEDALQEPLATLDRIDRVGLLARRFQMQPSEVGWLDPAAGFLGLAVDGVLSLVDGIGTAPAKLTGWRRAATLSRLRELVPGKGATLERVRTAATAADGLEAVERAFEVTAGGIGQLLAADTAVTQPTQLRDPLVLERVVNCAAALRRLPAPAATLVQLCSASLDQPAADAARRLVLSKLGPRLAGDGAALATVGAATDRLRDRQRGALVAYLVHRDGTRDATDLHGRYLLDVETGPSVRTSRIKQAISSVQLFAQRWLLNVEDPSLPSVPAALASQWEWVKSYRVWEANRRVFLYPENWLEPSLRDDKSHLFTKLEGELLQGDLTTDRAITLFENYLVDLQELGQLTVRAMYQEAVITSSSIVHVLARSPDNPPKFFYRRWTIAETSQYWTPWEPVDSVTNNEHAVCFVRAGRPHIAWLQIGRAVDEGSGVAGDVANWDVELLWTFRTNDGWSAPKKWRTRIRHPVLLNKDERVSFALCVRDSRGAPQLRIYGGRELGNVPVVVEPIPEFIQPSFTTRPKNVWTTSHRLQVQVVGQLDTPTGTRYVALDEASVQVWGRWFIKYEAEDGGWAVGTGDPPWPLETAPRSLTLNRGAAETTFTIPIPKYRIINKYAYLFVRATVAGVSKTVGPIDLDLLGNNEVRQGFRFQLSPNDPRFRASRSIRLVNIASFDWGSSLGLIRAEGDGSELAVEVPNAIRESSGFREETIAPLTWDGKALTKGANLVPFFAAASAGTDRVALGPPIYLEEAGFAGFFLRRSDGTWALLPASEYLAPDVLAALGADRSVIRLGPQDTMLHRQALLSHIATTADVSLTHVTGDAQFELPNAYSTYDWEIFFHIPFMVATALASQQRYAEALRWLHTIFDPTAAHGTPARAWQFKPFRDEPGGPGIDLLLEQFSAGKLDTGRADALRAQIKYWQANPFRPHGIARMRIRAYQWMVVYKYVDVLIAWGDQLFKRDTIESLNEATQLYLLAAQLLGPKPRQAPETPRLIASPTYAALAGKWDDFANKWIALADLPFFKAWLAFLVYLAEHGIVGPGQSGTDLTKLVQQLFSIGSLVFCVPPNDQTDSYRATVADRLRKIRSGQNIEGISRQLALFEPPIDPALLVRAVAAGLDIDTVLDDVAAAPSRYRFTPALQRAMEITTEVRGLANQLLSVLEKRDGEALARMRAVDEVALLELTRASRQRELDETLANAAVIRQSRQSAALRYRHYQRLLGKDHIIVPDEQTQVALEAPRLQLAEAGSGELDADLRGYGLTVEEADQLGWLTVGNTYTLIGGGFQVAAGIAHMVPNFSTKWFNEEVTFGGTNIGSGLGAVGQFFSMLSSNAGFQSTRSSIVAGHQRRYDDWILQSNLALRELEQIDRQLLAADIRVDVARKALHAHDKQLEDSRRVEEFMREKFTNEQLYSWMADRLAEAHSTAFNLAYDLAKRAEAALARDIGIPRPGIVRSGLWENRRGGLLAGELLAVDLRRLESAHMQHDERELEITKHLALSELDPVELLRLQTTGSCTFEVPESAFDMDFPGHYFRRIRSLSVSVPCVVGPYTSVAGTLTLLDSRTRVSTAVEPYPEVADDPRFVADHGPVQSIATSTGQNDAGVFELDFNQARYLPFERCGAVSRWRFELPREFRTFDYRTITDLVLHLRYTARDGGEALRTAASGSLRSLLHQASEAGSLVRTLSLRRDFPSEWHRLTRSPGEEQPLVIDASMLPYAFRDAGLSIWKLAVYARYTGDAAGGGAGISVSCPQPTQGGKFRQAPLALDEVLPSDIDGLARYDADLLASTDVEPVPFGTGGAGSTWQLKLAPEPKYHDIVLALWCATFQS